MAAPEKKPKKETKFCVECGSKISKKAELCPKCGVRQPMPEAKKDPTLVALLSFLWCGAGHVYLGQIDKGVILAVAYFILLMIGALTLVCFPLPVALWAYGIYDSYNMAKQGVPGK